MVETLSSAVQNTRLNNRGDFYTLWSVLLDFTNNPETIDFERTAARLIEFAEKVDLVPRRDEATAAGEDAVAYSQAVRAGTTKQSNREERKQILLKYIVCR
jgi:hypothetical protein